MLGVLNNGTAYDLTTVGFQMPNLMLLVHAICLSFHNIKQKPARYVLQRTMQQYMTAAVANPDTADLLQCPAADK